MLKIIGKIGCFLYNGTMDEQTKISLDRGVKKKRSKFQRAIGYISLFFFAGAVCYFVFILIATRRVADPAWAGVMAMFQLSFILAAGSFFGLIYVIISLIRFKHLSRTDKLFFILIGLLTAVSIYIATPILRSWIEIVRAQQESKDYYERAISQGDLSLCDKIQMGYSQSDCYYHIFKASRDPSLCESVQDQFQQSRCYRIIAGNLNDLSVCDKIVNARSEKARCYREVAQNLNDISICYLIEHVDEQGKCYSHLQDELDDPVVCEETKSSWFKKNECYKAIALNREDVSFCEKMESGSLRDSCYQVLAQKFDALSLCDEMETVDVEYRYGTSRNLCYHEVAHHLNDLSICDKITNQEIKWSCYRWIGWQLKDLSICDRIELQQEKDICYSNVGSELADSAICDQITQHQFSKDTCYRNVAQRLQEKSLCNRIQNESTRRNCRSAID